MLRGRDGRLMADIVLQLFSYVAEKERDFIRQRQAEGIARAQRRSQRWRLIGSPTRLLVTRSVAWGTWRAHGSCHNGYGTARRAGRGAKRRGMLRWVGEVP